MENQREGQPESWWHRWRSGWSEKKRNSLKKDQLLIGLLTGVLLIVIALPTERKGKETQMENTEAKKRFSAEKLEDPEEPKAETESGGEDSYTGQLEERLEQRLEQALSKVEGVGEVQVLITWKTSAEKIVEKDIPGSRQSIEEEDSSGGKRKTMQEEQEETTVYQEWEDGSRSPYVIKEILPEAEGVLVIARGGGNPVIAQSILEAVQALFPLDTHKIKIMKMEGS